MTKGVSVVVCCYNSEKRLPQTLQHLGAQITNEIPWEIIVVDNASTDKTAEVSYYLLEQYCPDISHRMVKETTPGLSFARIKGFEEAQYDLVLFVDDDNWLAEDYVQKVYDGFMYNPEIGIIGGHGEAVFEAQAPSWFQKYQENFAVGKQANTGNREAAQVELVYGAGFTVRKAIYEKMKQVGFKSILSDRTGDSLVSGGDNELCIVAQMAGYEIWYDSRLKFKHLMTESRLTWDYLKKLYNGFGHSKVYLGIYKYCLKYDVPPVSKSKHPYWEDRLSYIENDYKNLKLRLRLRKFFGASISEDEQLKLIALKGQRDELRKIGTQYEENFKQVLELKKKLQSL